MRILISALYTLGFVGLLYLDSPQQFNPRFSAFKTDVEEFLYDKELRIAGVSQLSSDAIRTQLPQAESVGWWMMNLPLIETQLLNNSAIERAQVKQCSEKWWGCFEVTIQERTPAFVAMLGERAWIIGTDGGVALPISRKVAQQLNEREGTSALPLVEGVLTDDVSPDIARSRLARIWDAIKIIQTESQERVTHVDVVQSRDLQVQFAGREFVTIFSFSDEDSWRTDLQDRSQRLKRLVQEFGSNHSRVQSIDFGFNRLAVVRARQAS